MMRRIFGAVLLTGLVSCGGSQNAGDTESVEVEVTAVRRGQALHVVVTGVSRGARPGAAFEQPEEWKVTAVSDRERLPRLVNGSAKITRNPVGHPRHDRWDVKVHFDTAFGLPRGASKSTVLVKPPGERPRRFAFASL